MNGKPIWRAASDQIDHAHYKGDVRALCGVWVIAERFAWPPTVKCPTCLLLVEGARKPSQA